MVGFADFSGLWFANVVSDIVRTNDDDDDSKDKEGMRNTNRGGAQGTVKYLVSLTITIAAIFYSVKCNDGFKFIPFLIACCCSPCYLAYALAMSCGD